MKRYFPFKTRSTLLLILFFLTQISVFAEKHPSKKNLVGHGGPVNTITISPDGSSALSGSLDYAVMLWDIESDQAKVRKRFVKHQGAVSAVEYFPSGDKALSSGDNGEVYLWNLKDQKLQQKLVGHTAKVVSISISNDARIAATSSWDGSIRLWDLQSLQSLHEIKIHNESVNAVLISADNKLVFSGGYDGRIRAWDIESGDIIKVVHRHGWPINIMRWLPKQQHIVFGTTNGDVQILDVSDLNNTKISKILIPHQKPVLGLAVSKTHNLIATGGNDGVIRVWKIDDWSTVGETRIVLGPVWALAFSANGQSLYYGSLDDDVKFWNISLEEDKNLWIGHKARRFQVNSGKSLGEVQFARKCSVCHTLNHGDANRAGPSLHKIFGRQAGTLSGYSYSDSLLESTVIWDEETIDRLFTKGPQEVVPGTKMPLQKVSDNKKRKALIDFLKQASN